MKSPLTHLAWIEELLPDHLIQRPMLGGVGFYLEEKFVLMLIETSKRYEYKGIQYPFEIWNGCYFPIDKIKQNTVIAKFPYLENHPASPNWLYLPREIEEFDERVKLIVREIKKKNPLFGSLPKMSKPKSSDVLVDFSKPQLFADLPKVSAIKKPKTPPKKKALPKNLKANKKSSNQLILSVLKRSIK